MIASPLPNARHLVLISLVLGAAAVPLSAQVNFDAPLAEWASNGSTLGWTISDAATAMQTEGGMLIVDTGAGLNRISSPDNLGLLTRDYSHIEFALRNKSGTTTARLWSKPSAASPTSTRPP